MLDFCDSCDWNVYTKRSNSLNYISCSSGGNSCFYAQVVEPMQAVEKLTFSTPQLKGATTAINAILKTVRFNTPAGLELCFLRVEGGVMLAWVKQDGPIEGEAVTPYSDPKSIRKALGLKKPKRKAKK